MSILAKLALVIGGLALFIIVVIVCAAFIDCLAVPQEKAVSGGQRRRSMTD